MSRKGGETWGHPPRGVLANSRFAIGVEERPFRACPEQAQRAEGAALGSEIEGGL